MNNQPPVGTDFANLLISGTVVIVFIAAIWYLVRKAGKNNLTVGQHLNRIFMREESTILIMLIGGMNIMEALVAASIHPQGGSQVNPVARFAMHLMFGFAGAFCAINAPKKIMEFFKDFHYFFALIDKDPKKSKKPKPIIPIIDLLLGLGLLLVSIGLPYANVMIMSTGLGEQEKFRTACWQLLPWIQNHELGISNINYSAMDDMTMVMQASFIALISHVFIAILDGLFAVYERYKYDLHEQDEARTKKGYNMAETAAAGTSTNNPAKPAETGAAGSKPKPAADDPHATQLKYILGFLDLANRDDAHTYYTRALSVMVENVGEASAAMSGNIVTFYNKCKKYNEEDVKDISYTKADLERMKGELGKDIRAFFRDSPKNGGFGMEIVKK